MAFLPENVTPIINLTSRPFCESTKLMNKLIFSVLIDFFFLRKLLKLYNLFTCFKKTMNHKFAICELLICQEL